MNKDLIEYFDVQSRIFGICPVTGEFFRLSDCRIFLKKRPEADWMDKLEREEGSLSEALARLEERKEAMREAAREKGLKKAMRNVRKVDKVFTPRRLNPDDAHVVFHPIDYVVFNGLAAGVERLKNVVLLDRRVKTAEERKTQSCIEKAVSKGRYEWITLRVDDAGRVAEEK